MKGDHLHLAFLELFHRCKGIPAQLRECLCSGYMREWRKWGNDRLTAFLCIRDIFLDVFRTHHIALKGLTSCVFPQGLKIASISVGSE